MQVVVFKMLVRKHVTLLLNILCQLLFASFIVDLNISPDAEKCLQFVQQLHAALRLAASLVHFLKPICYVVVCIELVKSFLQLL